MAETAIGEDKDVLTAIFEFNVEPEDQERMRTELPEVMTNVVSQ